MLGPLSPRHRRWKRFLKSLPLDPDALPRPLTEPGERDFIICGPPRTGTSLLTAALYQPPHALTVMEPWDGMRMPPADLFRSLRDEYEASGTTTRGRLDLETLTATGRVRWRQEGAVQPQPGSLDPGFLLGVKWPGYWRFLELLPRTKFLVCVRDPVAVVDSFKRQAGRVRHGLQYETVFNHELNASLVKRTRDRRLRRVLLLETIASGIAPHAGRDNVLLVAFERWLSDPTGQISRIANFLDVPLVKGPARIRAPASSATLTSRERDLVARHAPIARELFDLASSGS